MSLRDEKRNRIDSYLLKHIDAGDSDYVKETSENFGISATTVYNHIYRLAKDGIIHKNGSRGYSLQILREEQFSADTANVNTVEAFVKQLRQAGNPRKALGTRTQPNITDYSEFAQQIWAYVFREILNNALEHSESSKITCILQQTKINTTIKIIDDGVGIFRKIQQFVSNTRNRKVTLLNTIEELLPGRFTTDENKHIGKGIFFSSRLLDEFKIVSDGILFSHDFFNGFTRAEIPSDFGTKGTEVFMKLSNDSHRDISDVFSVYSDCDGNFCRTTIRLTELFSSTNLTSRSQARRLGSYVSRFSETELDFSGIASMGQPFAHEFYTFFPLSHPDIHIIETNMNDNVRKMIEKVKNTY